MAFYDNLDEKLARLGRAVVRKVKGTYRSICLSRRIRQEERKQKEIFLEMGKYYYQYYGPEAEGQMKVWCDAIWNNKTMVIQYQGQKRLIKGVTYCPECRKEVPEHSKYCNHCGARVPEKSETTQAELSEPFSGKVCPKCGAVSQEGFVFCSNCGSRLPEDEQDQRKKKKHRKENTETKTNIREQQEQETSDGETKEPVAAIGVNEEMTERTGLTASIRKFIREKSEAAKLKDEMERAVEANGFTDDERAVEVEHVLEEEIAGSVNTSPEAETVEMTAVQPESTETMEPTAVQPESAETVEMEAVHPEETETVEAAAAHPEDTEMVSDEAVSQADVVQVESAQANSDVQDGITATVVIGVVTGNAGTEKEETQTAVLRCRDCGNILEKGQNFCPKCGLKVEI
jgi:uncharacterized Zn finger protein (UPF0148 family)